MKKINKNYVIYGLIFLVVILVVIVLLLIRSYPNSFSFSHQVKSEDKKVESTLDVKDDNKQEDTKKENQIVPEKEDSPSSDRNQNQEVEIPTQDQSISQPNSNPSPNPPVESNPAPLEKNENQVVQYFETELNEVSTYQNQDNPTIRERVKKSFITVVDFIFYGTEIKGYTFQELTTSAKLKVLKVAMSIDHKIDQYFPNYKESIKDKYVNIKGKLAYQYLNFTTMLCESVGANTCNSFKQDFQQMKQSFGFTWSLLKELASSGSQKIKDFYENEFRN